MRVLVLATAFVFVAGAARAQSPYVAGTIGADISRFGHTDSTFSETPTSDAEVISGSVRVGTSVGQNWGVELEFVRSGRSHGGPPPPVPLPFAGTLSNATGALPVSVIAFQADVRQSHYDFDPVVWVRQGAGTKVDFVYLGGLAFSHERVEISQTFPTVLRALLPVPGPFRTTVVDYSTRPLVGAEARIGLTSHARLVSGLRLQGLTDGWLVRPYAGLGWFF